MKSLLIYLLVILPVVAYSQVVISSGTEIGSAANTNIVIDLTGNLNNNGNYDFSQSQLQLNLIGDNQTIAGNLVPTTLQISGGGTKTINGNLTIKKQINFSQGILKSGTSGKILYTGNSESLINANDASFVDGPFFVNSSGLLLFPVGTSGLGYAPAIVESGNGKEIGIGVINDNPGLSPDISEVDLSSIISSHYWAITSNELTSFKSRVKLSLNGIPPFGNELSPVVVEADQPEGIGFSLGSASATDNSVTSLKTFNRKILAIGATTKVEIKIHDLISPFTTDEINDHLYIENISKFPTNKVTLLDRWGVLIKEWKNFTNYNDPANPNQDSFDFKKLTPGNYICTVEYSSETQTPAIKSQMITVLKIK